MSTSASAGTSSNCRLAACIAARQRATRLQRVGLVGRQFGDQRRDAVRPRIGLVAGADRHRDHRPQRAVGQRVVAHQVGAQATGADRHDDVVDRPVGGLLDPLDVRQRTGADGEPAVLGDRLVPRRRRSRRRRQGDAWLAGVRRRAWRPCALVSRRSRRREARRRWRRRGRCASGHGTSGPGCAPCCRWHGGSAPRFDGIGSGVHDSGTMMSSPFGVGEVTISSMI